MYESEIAAGIKQLQAGSVDLLALAELTKIALSPACTPEQLSQITSAIYAVLDDSHLRKSKRDKTLPLQQVLCLSTLAPIIVRHHVYSEADDTSHTPPVLPWAELYEWIMYLKNEFVDQENVDFAFRLLAKRSIGEFFGVCDDTLLRDTFNVILESPGIIATLFSLWRLESQDPRFSFSANTSSHPMFHLPATLDSWMCSFSQREKWDWSEILRPFGGDAGALAATALDHLRQDVARTPINYNLVVWDIHLLTTLSVNDAIRISLLNQHAMKQVTTVINSMVDRHATADQPTIVAKAISYGYWYIRAYVESTEGLSWIAQTVETGLLFALLSTEPWTKYLDGPHSEDWEPLYLLLGEIIPKYSIYNSVLKPIIKQLAAIDMVGLPGKLEQDGLLFESWSMFDTSVRRRTMLYSSVVGNDTHIESCQNAKCDKSGPHGSFKSCAGCLHVHYCSKECQVNDWKNGNHQKYCRDIQARRAAGLVSRLSKRDVRFIDRAIAQDLRFFKDRIQNAVTTSNINPVVIELDYTEIPVHVDVGSLDTVSELETCECDASMGQKWHHMVELAQKSTTKKILVRAFLPGGTSEKVKFQCLPLKRILGDTISTTDDEAVSEFDETFDLLYSRAGQSFGVVDAAFPNEAMRASREMKEKQVRKEESSHTID